MKSDDRPRDAVSVLALLRSGLARGEERPGQVEMAKAVEKVVRRPGVAVVQAGTGTGKSLGYLAPLVAHETRAVVATSTIALQEQLTKKDLPFVAERCGLAPGSFAVLKGRSNYLCLQKIVELGDPELRLFEDENGPDVAEIAQMQDWIASTETGDRSEIDFEPKPATWRALSATSEECPGAINCPMGNSCFAERAHDAAETAQIIVTNTHLYALDVATKGRILPEHEVVVFDEGHEVEAIFSAALGSELRAGQVRALVNALKRVVDDEALERELRQAADLLEEEIRDVALVDGFVEDRRLHGGMDSVPGLKASAASLARGLTRALLALDKLPEELPDNVRTRVLRARRLIESLNDSLGALRRGNADTVVWTEGGRSIRSAPLNVGTALRQWFWTAVSEQAPGNGENVRFPPRSVVVTSATLPANVAERLAIPGKTKILDVQSPFDYRANSLLYVPQIPDPKQRDAWQSAVREELTALVAAAGGRTLALFTSTRAMRETADALRHSLGVPVLVQGEESKAAMVERLRSDPHVVLMATRGFFQGVDIPGSNLSLVVLDRIPFPRPGDPLVDAWQEAAGGNYAGFEKVAMPLAAITLAQAAGRLIRTSEDRGVVAVLDSRLATANYRPKLLARLPPMKRSRTRAEAITFLRASVAQSDSGTDVAV